MSSLTTFNDTDSGQDLKTGLNANFNTLNTDKKEQTDIDTSINTHKAIQSGVHGLAITAGKTLTVTNDATISGGSHSGTNTGDQTLPVKASGAEVDTGTDDAKFLTTKAVNDSHNVPMVAPGTSGNVLTSNGTDWTSAARAGVTGLDSWAGATVDGAGHQVTADGLLVVYISTGSSGTDSLAVYSDANATPTTLRAQFLALPYQQTASCCVPVRKNEYYKIVVTGASCTGTAFFIPFSYV